MTKRMTKAQATIRGVKGDRITVTIAPDPLDKALGKPPVSMLHILVNDGSGDTVLTDGDGTNASVIGMFTLASARKLHRALGDALAHTHERGRRRG